MTYIETINSAINRRISRADGLVCFGQNISTGSCLSGLTRGLSNGSGVEVINTPNCENALVAFGFGMMLEGRDSIYFVKQLDFLLLTLDQMVNTWNMVRQSGTVGSFTIVPVVVDSGFEGPQSRLNNLADFASLADIPCFALADSNSAKAIIESYLIAPGFRILAASQRLFRAEDEFPFSAACGDDNSLFQLANGVDATIVAFNFSWPQAKSLHRHLSASGISADLFGAAVFLPSSWDVVAASVARTGRLVLIDDSRCRHRPGDRLQTAIAERGVPHTVLTLYRPITVDDIRPNSDAYEFDVTKVYDWLQQSRNRA